MRKLLLALAAALALGAYAQDNTDLATWAKFARYAEANEQVKANPQEHLVVFMGNSITDHWANKRKAFFSDNGYVGRGISGQTTYQMLARFDRDVLDLNPEIVVITAGTNDVAENTCPYDENTTFDNIVAMCSLARINGVKVIICSIPPAAQFPWRKAIKDGSGKIQKLNARLRDFAASRGIPYVDYYSALVMPDNMTFNPELCNDGVHPNEAGYAVMEQIIRPAIDTLITHEE